MVIRRKGASDHGTGRGEVNRQLARDGRVFNIGDAFRSEERGENVAVLASFARCKRGQRPDREAETAANAVDMARADSGTGQDQQTVFGQKFSDLVHDRKDRVAAAIHDGAASDLHHLQPRQQPDRPLAGDGSGKFAVEQGLARERRGDVLDGVSCVGHDVSLSTRGDDGADVLASKRTGQVAGDKAIHNLHLTNVACRGEQIEHAEFEDRVLQPLGLHFGDRDL